MAKDKTLLEKYETQIGDFLAEYNKDAVKKELALIKSIALPSVLQLLQKGLSDEATKNKKITALNDGIPKDKLEKRYCLMEYQHRMHSDISAFSRDTFYTDEDGTTALKNPADIDKKREWNCPLWKKRSEWQKVIGMGDYHSKNEKEADEIEKSVERFINWAKQNPKTDANGNQTGENWEIALLTYYRGQEKELARRMQRLFNSTAKNFFKDENRNVEVKVFTVDKFQGQEADVVYISMVKSGNVSVGFMDSPNRLNVALTRAKYQRVIVGNRSYFQGCKSSLLRNFAQNI